MQDTHVEYHYTINLMLFMQSFRGVMRISHVFLGIGARSAGGNVCPSLSFRLTNRGGGVWFVDVMRFPPAMLFPSLLSSPRCSSRSYCLLRSSSRIRRLSLSSMPAFSSSSSSSSSSSPSAVSWSGGEIHSLGTTQGSARPMLAARLSQAGAGFEVSFSQSTDVKWLQLWVRRL